MTLTSLLLATACTLLAAQLLKARNSERAARVTARLATRHHRSLTGTTTIWSGAPGAPTSYDLRSFDSGATWVAIARRADGAIRIVGDADELFPALVTQLLSIDRLCDRIVAGPVSLAPGTAALIRATGLGLEVDLHLIAAGA